MPHLLYAIDDDDEFLHPAEGWLLLDRTIAYDSWITWRHALPRDPLGRGRLDASSAFLIQALAERIDAVHQRVSGYAALGDSPFAFLRWWDPDAPADWAAGGRCRFCLKGRSNRVMQDAWAQGTADFLELRLLPGDRLEAQLTSTNPADLAPSARPASRRQRPASRQGRPNPPARSARSAPDDQKTSRC